jgi:hypothetical protein
MLHRSGCVILALLWWRIVSSVNILSGQADTQRPQPLQRAVEMEGAVNEGFTTPVPTVSM